MYYTNTLDSDETEASTAQEAIIAANNEEDDGCSSGACKL
jgi:hypothetical protein